MVHYQFYPQLKGLVVKLSLCHHQSSLQLLALPSSSCRPQFEPPLDPTRGPNPGPSCCANHSATTLYDSVFQAAFISGCLYWHFTCSWQNYWVPEYIKISCCCGFMHSELLLGLWPILAPVLGHRLCFPDKIKLQLLWRILSNGSGAEVCSLHETLRETTEFDLSNAGGEQISGN